MITPVQKIALGKWDQAFLIPDSATEKPVALLPKYYKGGLVYRLPRSSKRVAYKKLKKNLLLKSTVVAVDDFILPF